MDAVWCSLLSDCQRNQFIFLGEEKTAISRIDPLECQPDMLILDARFRTPDSWNI